MALVINGEVMPDLINGMVLDMKPDLSAMQRKLYRWDVLVGKHGYEWRAYLVLAQDVQDARNKLEKRIMTWWDRPDDYQHALTVIMNEEPEVYEEFCDWFRYTNGER